jgi:hypothetical protein
MDAQPVNRLIKHYICSLTAAGVALALAGCGGSGDTGNVSQAEHTAPVGMWGGVLVSDASPATLTLTTSGGHFAFPCSQSADMTQPVQPDPSGHFSVAGTSTTAFLPLSPQPTQQPTQFTGTVTNHVMTVTLTVLPAGQAPYTHGPYTVTLGQAAPIFQGACPG